MIEYQWIETIPLRYSSHTRHRCACPNGASWQESVAGEHDQGAGNCFHKRAKKNIRSNLKPSWEGDMYLYMQYIYTTVCIHNFSSSSSSSSHVSFSKFIHTSYLHILYTISHITYQTFMTCLKLEIHQLPQPGSCRRVRTVSWWSTPWVTWAPNFHGIFIIGLYIININ